MNNPPTGPLQRDRFERVEGPEMGRWHPQQNNLQYGPFDPSEPVLEKICTVLRQYNWQCTKHLPQNPDQSPSVTVFRDSPRRDANIAIQPDGTFAVTSPAANQETLSYYSTVDEAIEAVKTKLTSDSTIAAIAHLHARTLRLERFFI